ncbi:putative reverse transcriptase domain-containing protein, partial [Tanacetum coccineum]
MMELHSSGKYVADNRFKPCYPQTIQDLMDVSLPNSRLQADPHIKSRLKTLKGNFGVMHDMVLGSSTSVFGWDPDKCVVTAPNDVWDAYVKTHPKAVVVDLDEEEVISETEETTTTNFEDKDVDMGVNPSLEIVGGKGTKRKRSKIDEFIHIYSSSSDTLNNTSNAIGNEMNITLSKMAN